jgi:hypothetical protein
MALQHFGLIAAFKTDDVVWLNGASNRNSRDQGLFFDDIIAQTSKDRMNRTDQVSDLVGRDDILSDIRRHNIARVAPIFGSHGRRKSIVRLGRSAVMRRCSLEINLVHYLEY